MTSERRKLVLGAGWTLASTVVGLGAGAILSPVLVLYLGVGGYGVWASAIAIASLFGIGGDLGVSGALTKFIAEGRRRQPRNESLAASALGFGVLAGCVAGLALAALSLYMGGYDGYARFPLLLRILALQMPFNLGATSLTALLQGRREFRRLAFFSIGQAVVNLTVSVALLELGLEIPGAMLASLLTSVLLFFGLLVATRRELVYAGPNALRADIRRLVPFGLTLTGTNALSTVAYQVDVVIVSFLVRNPLVIGAYALAVFVTRSLWILPGSIGTTTYPVISEYAEAKESRRVSRYLSTAMVASIAVTGVLGSALVLFGRPVLLFVFGPDSGLAFDFALLLLVGTAGLGSVRAVASAITAVGRPDVGLRIFALGTATLVPAAFIMTSLWGASGAAISVSVAFMVVAVAVIRAIDRYVLLPEPGLLRERRVAFTTAIAALAGALSLPLAISPNSGPVQWIVGTIFLAGSSLALLIASGGWDTWGTFFGKTPAAGVERG
jgi:O-antigen/teichoic acid export membrane protein